MDSAFCVEALEEAFATHGMAQIAVPSKSRLQRA
jgi:hypothetical protein